MTLVVLLYTLLLIVLDPTTLDKIFDPVEAGRPGSCFSQLSELR